MCQLNSSHICPYFLHLLDTFTEKIKKKKQKEQCLQKKSLQKHTAVHHLLPQAGYLITSEKKTNVGFRPSSIYSWSISHIVWAVLAAMGEKN